MKTVKNFYRRLCKFYKFFTHKNKFQTFTKKQLQLKKTCVIIAFAELVFNFFNISHFLERGECRERRYPSRL